jgi:hypothetical protein
MQLSHAALPISGGNHGLLRKNQIKVGTDLGQMTYLGLHGH